MYRLEDIKRVGRILIGGGLVTLLLGIIAQMAVGFEPVAVLINNAIYFALFGIGWFIFSQLVMSSVFNKLVDDAKRAKLLRVDQSLIGPPPGRWGQPYQQVELAFMALWAISVGVIQFTLGQNLSVPLAGVAGGWLAGGGAGRLRFVRIIGREQTEQQRQFYFGDSALGPATELAYSSERPEDLALPPVADKDGSTNGASGPGRGLAHGASSGENLPPGIKRRAGAAGPAEAKKSGRPGA